MTNENKTMKKIFIAGSNGMVGSAIKRAYLLKMKQFRYEVQLLTPSRNELDLTSYEKVDSWFSNHKPDLVIIAAAKVGGILANYKYPYEFILNNLKMQTNLIEISFRHKVEKLLFLGSSCIYPKLLLSPLMKNIYLLDH